MPRLRVPLGALQVDPEDEPTPAPLRVPLAELAVEAEPAAPIQAASAGRTWTDTAVDLLPAVGGVAGGIIGGIGGAVGGMGIGGVPGGIGGAALGGAAGEAWKQNINRLRGASAPETPGQAATDIGVQGAIQGAGQAVGGALAAGAGKAATYGMSRALNLTDRLSREFPQLSQTMIDKAIAVSPKGLAKARAMLTAAKGEANAALTAAHEKGATVPITAATDGLSRTLAKVMQSEDVEGGIGALAAVERKIAAGRAAAMTPMEADALKASLQTQSKALYLAGKMGQGRPNATIKAHALKDMATSLNQHLGDITEAAGAPGYRAANAEAAEMIGAVRGLEKGLRPGANLYQAMVRPGTGMLLGGALGSQQGGSKGAAAGALAGAAIGSPQGMSKAAIALSKPGVQIMLRNSPRLAAAVASYLAGDQQDEEMP